MYKDTWRFFMEKNTKRFLFFVGASVAAIYAYNKFVEETATQKKLLSTDDGHFFDWDGESIYYTKSGSGSPLLLIHDADATASSEEWSKIIHRLERKHTIYTLDLLGCGRSSKPAIEYTNYLYVKLITAFVKNIIQEKVTAISSNISSSFVIMANHLDNTLFEKLIFINPVSLNQLNVVPDELSKIKKRIIELPFIGTFVYNLMTSNLKIDENFRTKYHGKPQLISSHMEDIYYESAHTGGSNGRYLYSSLIGNYVNNTATHAVKKLNTPTLIIGCKQLKNYEHTLADYHKVNPNIEIIRINNGSLYPHMESPERLTSIIEDYLA